jgi:hypothetical protein
MLSIKKRKGTSIYRVAGSWTPILLQALVRGALPGTGVKCLPKASKPQCFTATVNAFTKKQQECSSKKQQMRLAAALEPWQQAGMGSSCNLRRAAAMKVESLRLHVWWEGIVLKGGHGGLKLENASRLHMTQKQKRLGIHSSADDLK